MRGEGPAMKRFGTGRSLRSALTAALCSLFFLLAMGITLMGSGVYRGVAAAAETHDTQRTALSYVINQVRRAQRVKAGTFGGVPALDLDEPGGDCHTVLYVFGGQLCELYAGRGTGLGPEDGVPILPLDGLELTAAGELLTVTAVYGGERYSVCVAPRTGLEKTGEVTV